VGEITTPLYLFVQAISMKQYINPPNAADIMGAYSHGLTVDVGDSQMIFVTGQIAMDSNGDAVAPDDIEKQTRFVFDSIQNILQEAQSSLDDIVKVVIYVTNMDDFPKISPIRNHYLAEAKPVSTLVEINKTVKEGCNIEIDIIAIKKK
jgi:2-iminobutanoate/2-iminopropanoate deaminase